MKELELIQRIYESLRFEEPTRDQVRRARRNARSQGIAAELLHPIYPRDFELPLAWDQDWEE